MGLGRRAVGAANSATAPPTIWSLIWFLRRRLQNKEGPHTKAAAVITIDYVPNPIHLALPDRHRPAPTIAPNPPSFLASSGPSPDHLCIHGIFISRLARLSDRGGLLGLVLGNGTCDGAFNGSWNRGFLGLGDGGLHWRNRGALAGLLRGPAGLNSDSPRAKRKRTTGRSPNERKKERGPALWLGCFSWGWLARSLLSHYAGNRQICGPATACCDEGNILKLNCPQLWASSRQGLLLYHELVVFFFWRIFPFLFE